MNITDIYTAQERLKPYLYPTPLLHSDLLSHKLNKEIWLKLETQQLTGSFKARPALNSILANLDQAKQHGVIASSSGNFAQGVAYAAQTLGVKAMIVMPESTSPFKIQRTKILALKSCYVQIPTKHASKPRKNYKKKLDASCCIPTIHLKQLPVTARLD